jgi:arylsulfatase A-like enzyme
VIGAVDLFPTLCALAGVPAPKDAGFDGVDMSAALLGKPQQRSRPLFWEYGRKADYLFPEKKDRSPNLAIRDGQWKLLINADDSDEQLYDLETDAQETKNVRDKHADVAKRLRE